MAKTKEKFKLRINYKSGISEEMEVYYFNVKGGVWKWETISEVDKPIILGIDDVESVWQIGYTPAQEI